MDKKNIEQHSTDKNISDQQRRAASKHTSQGSSSQIKPKLYDPEAAHRQFMAIMIGLFVLILILMIVFNEYFDFSIDGGV